jgi:hypothetical protein
MTRTVSFEPTTTHILPETPLAFGLTYAIEIFHVRLLSSSRRFNRAITWRRPTSWCISLSSSALSALVPYRAG